MRVFHLALRQFPHNHCRFNLSERELATVLVPWVRGEWIELGERKWNSAQATLKVLEGPELGMHELTMGRGWRRAERSGEDVTERVLAALRDAHPAEGETAQPASTRPPAAPQAPGATPETLASPDVADHALLADSLGLEVLAALDAGPITPARVWRMAEARLPGRPASQALALAERAVRALLQRRLAMLGGDVAASALDEAASWEEREPPPLLIERRT